MNMAFEKEKLLEVYYPIKGTDTKEVIALRKIVEVHDMQDFAGFGIRLNGADSLIIIGYAETVKLVNIFKQERILFEDLQKFVDLQTNR